MKQAPTMSEPVCLATPSCYCEPFAFCHRALYPLILSLSKNLSPLLFVILSEAKDLTQGKIRVAMTCK